MQAPLSRYPLLPVVTGIIPGILISQWDIPLLWALIPIIIGIALVLLRPMAYLGIMLLSLSIGWIDGTLSLPRLPDCVTPGTDMCYHGTVTGLRDGETSSRLSVRIDSIGLTPQEMRPCHGFNALIYLSGSPDAVYPGTEIDFNAILEIPANDNHPDAFDYVSFLRNKGIAATAFIPLDQLQVAGKSRSPYYIIRAIPARLESMLFNTRLSQESAAFLCAVLFGDTGMIDMETRLQYTTAGISHILALSGLHVAIITTMISVLLFPLYLMRRRVIARIATIFMLWLYAVMTGLSPSVTRAVIMATIYLVSLMIQRRAASGNSLAFAAICIILQPLSLFDTSFQLSFVAVGSILLFANRLVPRRAHQVVRYMLSIPAVSIAAMAGTAIVAAYRFHCFPIYFLVGNIFTSLLLPPIVGGGILLIFTESLGLPSGLLCNLINGLFDMLDYLTHAINNLPGAVVNNIYFDGWLLIPYFCALMLFAGAFVVRRKMLPALSGCLLLAFTLSVGIITRNRDNGHELLILKDTYFTNIICRSGSQAFLVTTAPPHDSAAQLAACQRRLRDYLGRRGCDSLILANNHSIPDCFAMTHGILTFGNRSICIVASDSIMIPSKRRPDYMLVTRGYKGNLTRLYATHRPDSMLLSNDIHPWRHNRYADSCKVYNIPFRSLKDGDCFYIKF